MPTLVAEAALPGESLTVLVSDRNLARRLRRRGFTVQQGHGSRTSTWKRMGLEAEGQGVIVVIALDKNVQGLEVWLDRG